MHRFSMCSFSFKHLLFIDLLQKQEFITQSSQACSLFSHVSNTSSQLDIDTQSHPLVFQTHILDSHLQRDMVH